MADYKELRIGIRADGSKFEGDVNSLYSKLKNGLSKPINPQMMESAFSKIPEKISAAFKAVNLNQFFQNFLAGFKNIFNSFGNLFRNMFGGIGNIFGNMFNNSQVKSSISTLSLLVASSLSNVIGSVFRNSFISNGINKLFTKWDGLKELRNDYNASKAGGATSSYIFGKAGYDFSNMTKFQKMFIGVGNFFENLRMPKLPNIFGTLGKGLGYGLNVIVKPLDWLKQLFGSGIGKWAGGEIGKYLMLPDKAIVALTKLGAIGGPIIAVAGAFTAVYKAARFVSLNLDEAAKSARTLATSTSMFIGARHASNLGGLSQEKFFGGISKMLMSFDNPENYKNYQKLGLSQSTLMNKDSIDAFTDLVEALGKVPKSQALATATKMFGRGAAMEVVMLSESFGDFFEDMSNNSERLNTLAQYSNQAEELNDNLSRIIFGIKTGLQEMLIPAMLRFGETIKAINIIVNGDKTSEKIMSKEDVEASSKTSTMIGNLRYEERGRYTDKDGVINKFGRNASNFVYGVGKVLELGSSNANYTAQSILGTEKTIVPDIGKVLKVPASYAHDFFNNNKDQIEKAEKKYADIEKEVNSYIKSDNAMNKTFDDLFSNSPASSKSGIYKAASVNPTEIENARKAINSQRENLKKLNITADDKEKLIEELNQRDEELNKLVKNSNLMKYKGNDSLQSYLYAKNNGDNPDREEYLDSTDFMKKINEKDLSTARKQYEDLKNQIWQNVDAEVLSIEEGEILYEKLLQKMGGDEVKRFSESLKTQFNYFDEFMDELNYWVNEGLEIPNFNELKNGKFKELFEPIMEELSSLNGGVFNSFNLEVKQLGEKLAEVEKLAGKYPELIGDFSLSYDDILESTYKKLFKPIIDDINTLGGDNFVNFRNGMDDFQDKLKEVVKLSEKYPELVKNLNINIEKTREHLLYSNFGFLKPSQYDKANELKSLNQLANTGTISESEYNIGKKNLLSDILTSQYNDSSYISGMKDLEYLFGKNKNEKVDNTDGKNKRYLGDKVDNKMMVSYLGSNVFDVDKRYLGDNTDDNKVYLGSKVKNKKDDKMILESEYQKELEFRNNNLMGELFGGEGFTVAKEIKSKLRDLDYMFGGNTPQNLKNQVMYGDIYKSGDESMKQIGQSYKDLMSEGYSDGAGFTDMGQVGTSMSRYGAKMDIELKNLAEQQLDVLRGIYQQLAERNYNMRLA